LVSTPVITLESSCRTSAQSLQRKHEGHAFFVACPSPSPQEEDITLCC
jgi:hypothetical protein